MVINEASPAAEATQEFAQKVFYELQQAILRHEADALSGDIEAIHDMRVGIRRLRVAIGNFSVCLSREQRNRLRTSLKNLADALGGVRDLDVMVDALRSKLASRPAQNRAAISLFISRLRSRRRRRHHQLAAYLQGEEYARFKSEFQAGSINEPIPGKGIEEFRNEQAA
ncbi:MAG TPA: CHAD domain-containing protein [Blastocatellia bacterium]|jgi:CHAD domain-containing protein